MWPRVGLKIGDVKTGGHLVDATAPGVHAGAVRTSVAIVSQAGQSVGGSDGCSDTTKNQR
jgi:hypothetical protein